MFGLEKATEKKRAEKDKELYDLELQIRDASERRKLKQHIQEKIRILKEALRKGENQEEYDDLGTLLSAYSCMEKLMEKVRRSLEREKQ